MPFESKRMQTVAHTGVGVIAVLAVWVAIPATLIVGTVVVFALAICRVSAMAEGKMAEIRDEPVWDGLRAVGDSTRSGPPDLGPTNAGVIPIYRQAVPRPANPVAAELRRG
jgi:hypothetical protein